MGQQPATLINHIQQGQHTPADLIEKERLVQQGTSTAVGKKKGG